MTRAGLALSALLALAACGDPDVPDTQAAADASLPEGPQPAPTALPGTQAETGGTDYTPPPLTPEAEKGEKGARNVLLSWAAAMEDRAFASAYALFRKGGPADGQSSADYAASFAGYRTIAVSIGNGAVEGAAGSLYYEVPLTLGGEALDGSPYSRSGTITLRRVNDVPGAEDWQLVWHIEIIDWQDEAGVNVS